jgi:hypothetical protein
MSQLGIDLTRWQCIRINKAMFVIGGVYHVTNKDIYPIHMKTV